MDIMGYLRQTNTVLIKKDAYEKLKEKAEAFDKIRDEIDLETRIQVKHYTTTGAVIDAVLDVIDEYKSEGEDL